MGRVFLTVIDSFGIGELPDAADYGDAGTNTLRSCMGNTNFNFDNMAKLGFFQIDGVRDNAASWFHDSNHPERLNLDGEIKASVARLKEKSKGKDTTIGHWEIAGVVSKNPLPTYPNGFPKEVLDEFSRRTGRGVLCNKTYSGTVVINDYGDEHLKTGDLIVYTSADSVFQIAAHEEKVPLEELYKDCRIAREILQGEHGVGRVIARPFIGTSGNYTRTSNRHDFSLEPTGTTMLDVLKDAGKDVLAIGKINDIFAGRGITDYVYTKNNSDGMDRLNEWMDRDFDGLMFVNLVDTDMVYGHRNDIPGYANALAQIDARLPEFLAKLRDDDVFMITADHGCDPGYTVSTDHSREHTPFIMYSKNMKPVNFGTKESFSVIAATVLKILGVEENLGAEPLI